MSKAKDLFVIQRCHAKARGIEFNFEFEEWVEWWEDNLGYNWMKKRGRARGKYVMARKGDKGPYAPWNVECILHEQNGKDCKRNGSHRYGERHGCAKLTEPIVRQIYLATGSVKDIAARFDTTIHSVRDIRNHKSWTYLTKGLGPSSYKSYQQLDAKTVIKIFKSEGSYSAIGRKFGRPPGQVRDIKLRNTWRNITEGL